MKSKFILGLLAVSSLGLASCSEDTVIETPDTPTPEQGVNSEVKLLTSLQFVNQEGLSQDSTVSSRTPIDVDDLKRPTTNYFLNHVFMLGLKSTTPQPTPSDLKHEFKQSYTKDLGFYQLEQHNVSGGVYNLYYQLIDVKPTKNPGFSNKGKIRLAQSEAMTDYVELELSIFSLADLQSLKPDQKIYLNQFGYGSGETTLRGDILRYISYDPQSSTLDISHADKESGHYGNFAKLPEMPKKYNFLKDGEIPLSENLVYETQDKFFSGHEFLVAADDSQVYLMEVIPEEGRNGGFFLRRTYPSPKGHSNPDILALNRLTSIVNLSFMLVDPLDDPESYYVPNDEVKSIANFKKKYGLDLTTLECPYATIDGINTRFYLNEREDEPDKTSTPGRLVVWAKDHKYPAVDGKIHDNMPSRSNNILYQHGLIPRGGYGIQGNSYAVIFQGFDTDTKNQDITFWVSVNGVKVKIQAPIQNNTGIPFTKNVTTQIISFISAQDFSEFVKANMGTAGKSRVNGDDEYLTYRLPAGSVVVK